jgi:hypothetical protein
VTDIRNIVILTGAGISAESGIATFRGPDGLWEGHRVEDLCPCPSHVRMSAFDALRTFGNLGTFGQCRHATSSYEKLSFD